MSLSSPRFPVLRLIRINLGSQSWLLPREAHLATVEMDSLSPYLESTPGMLGETRWEGQTLPVFHPGAILGLEESSGALSCLELLNGFTGYPHLRAYSFSLPEPPEHLSIEHQNMQLIPVTSPIPGYEVVSEDQRIDGLVSPDMLHVEKLLLNSFRPGD
jgi:hypothetical protein